MIGASINACFNIANANLAPKVRKSYPKLSSINNLDLAKKSGITVFLDFTPPTLLTPLLILSIILSSLTNGKSLIKSSDMVFLNIKMNEAAIWLKP